MKNCQRSRTFQPNPSITRLLERIITASSNDGDLVLDPFCGCGTTIHAAQKLGRQWVGKAKVGIFIAVVEVICHASKLRVETTTCQRD